MLTNEQRAFIAHYASIGCTSIADSLLATRTLSPVYREWCQSPEFTGRLLSMLASLADALPAHPLAFAPEPPLTINYAGMGIDLPPMKVDPYGPQANGKPFNFATHSFGRVAAADADPRSLVWFGELLDWKSVDAAIRRAAAE